MTTLRSGKKGSHTFRLTYFKENGKYYTEATVTWKVNETEGGVYMPDVMAKVRGLSNTDGQGALPGLSGGRWSGFILVDCDEGYPCLILPPKE